MRQSSVEDGVWSRVRLEMSAPEWLIARTAFKPLTTHNTRSVSTWPDMHIHAVPASVFLALSLTYVQEIGKGTKTTVPTRSQGTEEKQSTHSLGNSPSEIKYLKFPKTKQKTKN